tara:strand:- start:2161 stop:2487 length:327 start_codon:yes stop_codon:yes gene_type:complete
MQTAQDLAEEIMALKLQMRALQAQLDEKVNHFYHHVSNGLVDDYKTEDSAFQIGTIRVKPVQTRRWSYNKHTKYQIKKLQEEAQLLGFAKLTTTTSFRFTDTADASEI